jgi:hypothetical protein
VKHLPSTLVSATIAISLAEVASGSLGWAQTAPPIIVPQVQPRFNNPGPQLTIPQPANPLQQRTVGPGSTFVPGRSAQSVHRHLRHTVRHVHVSRKSHNKRHNEEASSNKTSENRERQIGRRSQEQDQAAADKKLKELDEALGKKLQGICRGC